MWREMRMMFGMRCPVGAGDDGMADQVGHDEAKVIKKYEFQLQAAGTRFSLIYSAAGRYGASQIHSYLKTKPDSLTNQRLPGIPMQI